MITTLYGTLHVYTGHYMHTRHYYTGQSDTILDTIPDTILDTIPDTTILDTGTGLQSNRLLDHHKVDKQHDKDDEEGGVEQSVLNQCSQYLLPETKVTGQHVGLLHG